MCDFSTEVKKDNALKKFLTSIANQVRDAIKQIKIALGADPTGQLSWVASMLNKIKRILDWINKEIVQPIINFEKLVIGYIQKIQAIISWILSLPARLAQMLADCLKALYKLIANTFTDLESSSGGLSTDLLSTAKSVVSSASSLYSATSLAVTNASTITMTTLNAATVQPTSAVTAASAAAAIVDYTSTLPSSDTVANNVASDTKPNTSMP
jgi:phage-related protein